MHIRNQLQLLVFVRCLLYVGKGAFLASPLRNGFLARTSEFLFRSGSMGGLSPRALHSVIAMSVAARKFVQTQGDSDYHNLCTLLTESLGDIALPAVKTGTSPKLEGSSSGLGRKESKNTKAEETRTGRLFLGYNFNHFTSPKNS